MTKGLKVLSLFDGISCGLQAVKNLNIPVETYDAFEIDKYAITIAKKNHPEINHHGSVIKADFSKFEGYDLLLGGFPCPSFSGAGKQLGFDDPRGQLFFDLLRALEQVKPKYFLLENVVMKKECYLKIKYLVREKIHYNCTTNFSLNQHCIRPQLRQIQPLISILVVFNIFFCCVFCGHSYYTLVLFLILIFSVSA